MQEEVSQGGQGLYLGLGVTLTRLRPPKAAGGATRPQRT